MSDKRKQGNYTEEFKDSAIQLAIKSDKPVAQVARELNINISTLHTWITKYKDSTQSAVSISTPTNQPLMDELKRLKKENAQLKEEQAILKKAAAYFARETK